MNLRGMPSRRSVIIKIYASRLRLDAGALACR